MGQGNSTEERAPIVVSKTELMEAVVDNDVEAVTLHVAGQVKPGDLADCLWEAITRDRADVAKAIIPRCVGQCERIVAKRLFCYAAFRGDLAIVQEFATADESLVGAIETHGKSALDFAELAGRSDVAEFLHSRGAQPTPIGEDDDGGGGNDEATATIQAAEVPATLRRLTKSCLPAQHAGVSTVPESSNGSKSVSVAEALAHVGFMVDQGENIPFTHILPCGFAGRGSFGRVTVGYYKNRRIAFKVEGRSGDGFTEMDVPRMAHFAREARALRLLQHPTHPHCLGFMGVAVDSDVGVAIVTEYVGGGTLRSLLREGGIDPVQRLAICTGLASGLAFIHETGIVHGDIKPANVLMTENGFPKIIDFGGAYPYWRGKTAYTKLYAAPEVLAGGLSEAKSDVFSVACVMYEVFIGQPVTRAGQEKAAPMLCDKGINVVDFLEFTLPEELQGKGVGQVLANSLLHEPTTRPRSNQLYAALLSALVLLDRETADTISTNDEHVLSCESTSLMTAVQYQDFAMTVHLLDNKYANREADRWSRTPLHVAVAMGDADVVRLVLSAIPLVLADDFGITPFDIISDMEEWGVDVGRISSLLTDYSDSEKGATDGREGTTRRSASEVALLGAVRSGDLGRVCVLVERGVNPVTSADDSGVSAVELACRSGYSEVVAYLLERSAHDLRDDDWERLVNSALSSYSARLVESVVTVLVGVEEEVVRRVVGSCFQAACEAKEWRKVELFARIDGVLKNFAETSPWSPLVHACEKGYLLAVEILLKAGVNPNSMAERWGWARTALAAARDVACIRKLIDAGADVNATTADGKTALMYADDRKRVQALIVAGADVTARDNAGRTALMNCPHSASVKGLIKAGGDVNAIDAEGRTALMHCVHAGKIEVLVNAGADVNAVDAKGKNALMHTWNVECVRALVDAGVDVNAAAADGTTPLIHFAAFYSIDTGAAVSILLNAGANVNATTTAGRTALSEACWARKNSVVRELLAAGADVSLEPSLHTAIDVAHMYGHPEIVNILEEHVRSLTE